MEWLDKLFGNKDTPRVAGERPRDVTSRLEPMTGMFVCRATVADRSGLYLLGADGGVTTELAQSGPGEWFGEFAVSPDARWVVYTRHVPRRPDRDPFPTICAVPAAGGASHELRPWEPHFEACYQNPVFSPTGASLVCEFGLRDAYNPDLQVLQLDAVGDGLYGFPDGPSITTPMRIGNHASQFMPDGKRIVYFGNFAYEDLLEVCLYDPAIADHDGTSAVGWRLTHNADGVWRRPRAIAIQPEWEQIFFIQGHTRNAERVCVFVLADLSPGTHRKIFDAIGKEHGTIGSLDVSPDGLRLCYDGDGVIYVVGCDGANLRAVSPQGLQCTCPRFSKDGKTVAFLGGGVLHLADPDGSAAPLHRGDLRIDSFVRT